MRRLSWDYDFQDEEAAAKSRVDQERRITEMTARYASQRAEADRLREERRQRLERLSAMEQQLIKVGIDLDDLMELIEARQDGTY